MSIDADVLIVGSGAAGLTAALNLAELPENAYYGMFIDSDGPAGIMKPIPERLTACGGPMLAEALSRLAQAVETPR